MTVAYIAVGSNLGDRLAAMEQARQLLQEQRGIEFLRASEIYETDPVGGPRQGKYLNAVWEIKTSSPAIDLLHRLLQIENELGRVRREVNGPRIIDLDILFYGSEAVDLSGLHIPHPRLHLRGFVLKPLMDLCPNLVHPKFNKTVSQLWRECRDFYAVPVC